MRTADPGSGSQTRLQERLQCGEDVVVEQGNHVVKGFETVGVCRDEIEILHFPFRSLAQFQHKIVKGGQAYQRNTRLSPGVGVTWRKLYEHYDRHGRLPDENLAQLMTAGQITEALRQGNLIEDRRLLEFMARLPDRGQDKAD